MNYSIPSIDPKTKFVPATTCWFKPGLDETLQNFNINKEGDRVEAKIDFGFPVYNVHSG